MCVIFVGLLHYDYVCCITKKIRQTCTALPGIKTSLAGNKLDFGDGSKKRQSKEDITRHAQRKCSSSWHHWDLGVSTKCCQRACTLNVPMGPGGGCSLLMIIYRVGIKAAGPFYKVKTFEVKMLLSLVLYIKHEIIKSLYK